MYMGMGKPKTGLFGKPWEAPGTPGIGDGMTQPEQPMMSAIRAPMEQPKPGLGTRLFGKGWEDKAFALGGMLRGDPTGAYMMRQEKQREQDALAQAAAEQRKYSMDLAMHDAKKQIDKRYDTPEVGVFEDNAGNRWTYDKATGRPLGEAPVFVDGTPKEFVHEGMRFSIQNPYLRGQNPGGGNIPCVTAEASYNALPAGSQFYDDEGKLRTKSGGPTQPASGGF